MNDFGMSQADIDALNATTDAEAQASYDFAEESPLPDVNKLYDYVYADQEGN